MQRLFWLLFIACAAFKVLLIPAPHSTDFEVHRNWLAITYSLPLRQWYVNDTSEWTLDYPPLFAYFEWALAQVAEKVDANMLRVDNLNYASWATIYFQRSTVIITDIVFAIGTWRCLRALAYRKVNQSMAELLLLANVGFIFVDNIHFQYNSFLFGILLLSISFLLEDRALLAAFMFSLLLNFKHIFLYMAPAYAIYLLKFYCLQRRASTTVRFIKLLLVGLLPFICAYAPFWRQLPQVLARLFPFKRGLTHAYWAPNFWAFYNSADILLTKVLHADRNFSVSSTKGLVQNVEHFVLPQITPLTTFLLTLACILPILIKLLFFTQQSSSKLMFLRALTLCSTSAYMFGWHVHEKAILMCIIPLCLLAFVERTDARYAFLLSFVGHYSLLPLLYHPDLLVLRYALYLAYMALMYSQLTRLHNAPPALYWFERLYMLGFVGLPLYEHMLSPLLHLDDRLPFMTLLLTSLYCSFGVIYCFIMYYSYALNHVTKTTTTTTTKTKLNGATNVQQRNSKIKSQ